MELMKERFSKLLLGEDMSGGGKGTSSALALSNAITNLSGTFFSYVILICSQKNILLYMLLLILICCFAIYNAASVFGEQSKLEPMSPDRKTRWRKEIEWLLSVTDHIVEFIPSQQKSKDGTNMEVINLSRTNMEQM